MKSKPKVFWFILTGQALFLLLVFLSFTRLTAGILQHEFDHHTREDLKKRALLFSLAVGPDNFRSHPEDGIPIRTLTEIARQTETRLTLIRQDGSVSFDSSADIRTMDNHADREEIASALKGQQAYAVRYSQTLKHDRLYYAIPCHYGENFYGVLRVSANLKNLKEVNLEILSTLRNYGFLMLSGLIIIMIVIANVITTSLGRFSRAATMIAEGNYNTEIPESMTYEMNQVSQAMTYLSYELKKKMKKLSEDQDELVKQTLMDELTQLGNRRKFDSFFEYQWNSCKRSASPLSLIILDIDYFKQYNDKLGHPEGDRCLQQLSRVLASTIKRSDDVLVRLGGEEFAALLPASSHEKALHLARSIAIALKQAKIPHPDSSVSPYLTLSIGVATIIPVEDTDRQDLYNHADACLYNAKKTGRNRIKGCSID